MQHGVLLVSTGIDHPFANFTFTAPPGEEDRVGDLRVFITTLPGYSRSDGKPAITSVTTCWQLEDSEVDEIVRTRRVMMNAMGGGLMAHYITSPESMREFVTAFGETWGPDKTFPVAPPLDKRIELMLMFLSNLKNVDRIEAHKESWTKEELRIWFSNTIYMCMTGTSDERRAKMHALYKAAGLE